MDEITVEDCKIVKSQRDGGRSVEDIAEMYSWTTEHAQRIVDADVESLVMKDKIEKLLEQIKKDFPNGCIERDCSTCPLERNPTREAALLCDMLVKLHTGEM